MFPVVRQPELRQVLNPVTANGHCVVFLAMDKDLSSILCYFNMKIIRPSTLAHRMHPIQMGGQNLKHFSVESHSEFNVFCLKKNKFCKPLQSYVDARSTYECKDRRTCGCSLQTWTTT